MSKLILVDANSLIHRAYHALPRSIERDGKPINAAYGFTRMVINLIKEQKPAYLALLFDSEGPTFRHEIAETYKETRPEIDEELLDQFPIIEEVMKAFDIPCLALKSYEADDLIATLKKKFEGNGLEVVVVTGDRDMLQLIDTYTKVLMPIKGVSTMKLYGDEEVQEKFKIHANQVVDYKALRGDPSDNIPGVPGIGDKTAVTLLKEYGDLDTIYEHVDEIDGRVGEILRENKEEAYLSQKLVKLEDNVPVDIELNALAVDIDAEKVREVFEKYRFRSLLKQLDLKENDNSPQLDLFS